MSRRSTSTRRRTCSCSRPRARASGWSPRRRPRPARPSSSPTAAGSRPSSGTARPWSFPTSARRWSTRCVASSPTATSETASRAAGSRQHGGTRGTASPTSRRRSTGLSPKSRSLAPRVEQTNSGCGERSALPSDESEVVLDRRRGEKPIDHGQRLERVDGAPPFGDRRRDRKKALSEVLLEHVEPTLELVGLLPVAATAEPLDPPPDLPDNQHAEIELTGLRLSKPVGDAGVRTRLTDLGDDIRVEQVAHSSTTGAGSC